MFRQPVGVSASSKLELADDAALLFRVRAPELDERKQSGIARRCLPHRLKKKGAKRPGAGWGRGQNPHAQKLFQALSVTRRTSEKSRARAEHCCTYLSKFIEP